MGRQKADLDWPAFFLACFPPKKALLFSRFPLHPGFFNQSAANFGVGTDFRGVGAGLPRGRGRASPNINLFLWKSIHSEGTTSPY